MIGEAIQIALAIADVYAWLSAPTAPRRSNMHGGKRVEYVKRAGDSRHGMATLLAVVSRICHIDYQAAIRA